MGASQRAEAQAHNSLNEGAAVTGPRYDHAIVINIGF